jgi:hypothetical protein
VKQKISRVSAPQDIPASPPKNSNAAAESQVLFKFFQSHSGIHSTIRKLYFSMGSLSLSTPKKNAPQITIVTPPSESAVLPSQTTPSKKYYVVTKGRCAGVFDRW